MYLLGHLGFTSVIGFLFDKYNKFDTTSNTKENNSNIFKWFFLLLGSMAPDIIDKPIGSLFFSTGRWIGHTLLFIILGSIIITLLFKFSYKGKILGFYFFIGNLMHLLLDQPSLGIAIPFFPLFPDPFIQSGWNTFLFGFTNPFVLVTETIGLLILIFLIKYYNLKKNYVLAFNLFIIAYISLYLALYYFWVLNV